jgi:hypothetical protein
MWIAWYIMKHATTSSLPSNERKRLRDGRGKKRMILLMHLILNGKIYTNRYVKDSATFRRSFAQKDALQDDVPRELHNYQKGRELLIRIIMMLTKLAQKTD